MPYTLRNISFPLFYFFSLVDVHHCFETADQGEHCFDLDSRIVFVTSFNSRWYSEHRDKAAFIRFDELKSLNVSLIVYHEDDLPDIPGVCQVNLREAYPFLFTELLSNSSGLNKYFDIASHWDPLQYRIPNIGDVSYGHVLMLKVATINHAVQSANEGQVVFWVDTDVTFRKQLPDDVIAWLLERDVTYIPFNADQVHHKDMWAGYNTSSAEELLEMIRDEWWHVESGLMSFTVNDRTRRLTEKALDLYQGGMYHIAKACFNGAKWCHEVRVSRNVYMNDIFVWALLLHSDIFMDELFYVGLKHGWFAMKGLEPWGPHRSVWGVNYWKPSLAPVHNKTSIITYFHIGEYVFHHFGHHLRHKNSLKIQPAGVNDSWRYIQTKRHYHQSLMAFLGTPFAFKR